ncbi:unnamed protein product, partial [Closterium sp. NIES-54]
VSHCFVPPFCHSQSHPAGTVSHRLLTSAPLPRQRVSRLVTEAKVREIFMPALSSTMTEGKIVAWSKSEGETVSKGESVVVVESDKADMDVETFYDGIIATILVGEGEVAPVGAAIAILAESEDDMEAAKKKAAKLGGSDGAAAAAAPAAPAAAAAPAPAAAAAPPPPPPAPAAPATPGKVVATPEAKKLAKKHKVDLAKVAGSGPYGRITPDDIKKAAGIATAPAPTIAAPAPAAASPAPVARAAAAPAAAAAPLPAGASVVAFTAMQGAVARNMEATLVVPTFRVGYTVTTDALDALYKRLHPLPPHSSLNSGFLPTLHLSPVPPRQFFVQRHHVTRQPCHVTPSRRCTNRNSDSLRAPSLLRAVARASDDAGDVAQAPSDVAEVLGGMTGYETQFSADTGARVVAVVGADVVSPYGGATWDEVIRQMARRVNWVEPSVQLLVFSSSSLSPSSSSHSHFLSAAQQADLLLAVAVNSAESAAQLVPTFSTAPARVAFDCHVSLSELTLLGGLNPEKLNLPQKLAAKWGWWKEGAKAVQVSASLVLKSSSGGMHGVPEVTELNE